ncbi:MAG: HD domain-containing protein [Methylotenera sp.]|nr:HD domain-containing protein [Methylotenera sp.]
MKNEHKWTRLALAFDFAAREHQHQIRKSTDIPYISHLMSVSALIFENGGDEDHAIAGLLHDVIEDAEPNTRIPFIRAEIKRLFGDKVLQIVEGCTDGEPDDTGMKSPWKPRKESYLKRLESKDAEFLLVSCCDKLHNARSILIDLKTVGASVFNRFSTTQEETIWYYTSLANIFSSRLQNSQGAIAAMQLSETVSEIQRLTK